MSLINRLQDDSNSDPEHRDSQPKGERRPKPRLSTSHGHDRVVDLRGRVQQKMLDMLEYDGIVNSPNLRQEVENLFNNILAEEGVVLSRNERRDILEQVMAEIGGLGPLEPLLADDSTTDILVVGPDRIYVERKGHLHRTNIQFEDGAHLKRIIERITAPLGRRIDESSPMVDARLPDGSRVNAVIPPIALDGAALTIRRFSLVPLTQEDLIGFGTATPEVFEFLRASVVVGMNLLISGGSSSGKTTLLNLLSGFIPTNERVITIENAAELQLRQPHVVRLETRPPNVEGEGEVTIRDLVVNALRMRPDRLIVGEVRGGEAIDLLQAMITGRDGSMGTIHANSTADALSRLETMCLMAGIKLPVHAIRAQVTAAINMVVQMERSKDGKRKITAISEVQGMEGDMITMVDLFAWERTSAPGVGEEGRLMPTGLLPNELPRFIKAGIHFPPAIFGLETLEARPRAQVVSRTTRPEPQAEEAPEPKPDSAPSQPQE